MPTLLRSAPPTRSAMDCALLTGAPRVACLLSSALRLRLAPLASTKLTSAECSRSQRSPSPTPAVSSTHCCAMLSQPLRRRPPIRAAPPCRRRRQPTPPQTGRWGVGVPRHRPSVAWLQQTCVALLPSPVNDCHHPPPRCMPRRHFTSLDVWCSLCLCFRRRHGALHLPPCPRRHPTAEPPRRRPPACPQLHAPATLSSGATDSG
eukprot:SAG11_NODE_2137_length_3766_cov_2.253613_3_plen_205_part_00